MSLLRKPFYYVRHGETDYNKSNLAMGHADIPLNETGIQQAHNLKEQLKNLKITTICHSPLVRAHETAIILNETLKANLMVIEELQEFNLGPHSGKEKGEWFDSWRKGHPLEGAEAYQDFIQRALSGINKSLEFPGPVLIVAHGGVYWAVQEVLQNHALDLSNCAIVSHTPKETGWHVSLTTF